MFHVNQEASVGGQATVADAPAMLAVKRVMLDVFFL